MKQVVPNDEIRVQRKILGGTGLLSLPNCIRENIRNHDKKENEKRDTTSRRNKIDIKKRRTKKSRIRISKKIMNILRRQE